MTSEPSLLQMDRHQTEHMAELIAERHQLMAAILKSATEQEAAVREGLVERLISCLNEKQRRVDRLAELQRRLAPYAACPPERRDWAEPEDRERCRRQIAETTQMQEAILAIDRRCEEAMRERRDELFGHLQASHDVSRAARAYREAAAGSRREPSSDGSRGAALDVTNH